MRTHAGPVFALARIQGNIFEDLFSAYSPNFWGNSFWCKYRKVFLRSYLFIGFVSGGTLLGVSLIYLIFTQDGN